MYKCKNCGGELHYAIKGKMLVCDHCDSRFHLSTYRSKEGSAAKEMLADDTLYNFSCPNCGGEIITNDHRIDGYCSYCGSHVILERHVETRSMPQSIAPFTVTKEECEERYLEYVEKYPFVPKEYRSKERKLDFRGIYVPFYSYEAEAGGSMLYHSTETRKLKGRKRHTDEYEIQADVQGKVSGIEHDASLAVPDYVTEDIVPASDKLVDFQPAYLSGFYADLGDVDPAVYDQYVLDRAQIAVQEQVDRKLRSMFFKNAGLSVKKDETNLQVEKSADILLPLWFMSRRTGDRVVYAIINGETKGIVADLPVDLRKFGLVSLIVSAILFCILQTFHTATPTAACDLAAFFNLIAVLIYYRNVASLHRREIQNPAGDEQKRKRRKRKKWILLAIAVVLTLMFLFTDLVFEVVFLVWSAYAGLLYHSDRMELRVHGTRTSSWILGNYLIGAALLILVWMHPVSDLWYYAGEAICFALVVLSLVTSIRDYNLVCSNPLPQFAAYEGGRDGEDK